MYQAHQYHGDVSHKRLHPNKPQEERMQPHKQVALKTDKHKPTEDAKHGKSWIKAGKHGYKAGSKQAYICIKEMIQTF